MPINISVCCTLAPSRKLVWAFSSWCPQTSSRNNTMIVIYFHWVIQLYIILKAHYIAMVVISCFRIQFFVFFSIFQNILIYVNSVLDYQTYLCFTVLSCTLLYYNAMNCIQLYFNGLPCNIFFSLTACNVYSIQLKLCEFYGVRSNTSLCANRNSMVNILKFFTVCHQYLTNCCFGR